MELKYRGIQCCYEDHIENAIGSASSGTLPYKYSENVPTLPFFAYFCPGSHFRKIDCKGREYSSYPGF